MCNSKYLLKWKLASEGDTYPLSFATCVILGSVEDRKNNINEVQLKAEE